MRLEALFNSMWEEAQSEIMLDTLDISRVLEVHPSQIPICPVSFILNFSHYDDKVFRTTKMLSDCILRTGTTIHEVVQKYLGLSNKAFGNFACPNCGQVFDLTTGGCCPDCKDVQLVYFEVPINYKGFAGHVDFMIKDGDDIYLVDFKTSSAASIDEKVKNTPVNYNLQTLAYVLLLRLQYGLKIKGRAIVYISRDNPRVMKIGGVQKTTKKLLLQTRDILKQQRELLDFLLDCTSYEDFQDNIEYTPCSKCTNQYCKYKTLNYSDEEIEKSLKKKFDSFKGVSIRQCVQKIIDYKEETNRIIDNFADMCKGVNNENQN